MKKSLLFALMVICAVSLTAQSIDVLPVRISEGAQTLNGTWAFNYIPSSNIGGDEKFFQEKFSVAKWDTTAVPSHWELNGYTKPEYNDSVREGTGLYRRTFTIPKDWQQQNQRVFLRFDGVLYGFTVWVNEKQVGEWNSSFNQSTFDITDALKPAGAENLIAVRVTTRSKGWNFDNMDCWALSGIYRDVTLFALPQTHLRDYTAVTTLKPDGSAKLKLDVVTSAPASVTARLIAPDGKPVTETTLATRSVKNDSTASTTITVASPTLWTAESPSLYRLELDINANGKTVQRYTDRIGLRQVTIEDGILKLNGTPIKLRGIDHHDIWPEGRIATEQNMRRDLELMRAANINFIRTAHYPPHPRLLELCDEMGFYVDDEVPYVHGRKHLKDPAFQDELYKRSRAAIMRDKNRPCIIFWSLGNENTITELGLNNGKYARKLDPSRPITFPSMGFYFDENWKNFPDYVGIYAPHYPSLRTAARYAEELKRPIVFTEYAHQRGLTRAGISVQDLWELFYRSPRIAGGAIWMFQDQGILRMTPEMNSVKDADLSVWIDEHHYYDTFGYYGMDGIVYSDRTPQIDYWQVRKVYSPVQIAAQTIAIKAGAQTLSLSVENRFDFRTLAGMTLRWSLLRNNNAIQSGSISLSAKPKQTETISIAATLPETLGNDVFILSLQTIDESGQSFYERSIRLDAGVPAGTRFAALNTLLPKSKPALETTDALITIRNTAAGYELKLDRRTGQLSLLDKNGETIVSDFGPHTGRHPTINDMSKRRERLAKLWLGNLLRDPAELKTSARETGDGIELTVAGNYPRPGIPAESVRGEYKLLITQNGAIKVSYDYAPLNATGEMLEVGFALSLPKNHPELRWLGKGPFAGYFGKDRLNEYGIHHLNRDDLYFHGNRREVEFASLARTDGTGVLLCGADMTVDLENITDATILSHLAEVPGQKHNNKTETDYVDVSARLNASEVKRIAGAFTLIPLGVQWPAPLTNWLGDPSTRAKITKSFFRSYDQ